MRLPSRWVIVVMAVVVAALALLANAVALQLESPAAELSASTGPPLPTPASATLPGGEHTRSFDIVTRVAANGDVRVHETIVQDFGVVARHGIERVIPLRDNVGEHRISDLVVSTSQGTPDGVSINAQSDQVTIRIGDADQTITGAHTYRLAYDLGGMIDARGANRSRLAIDALSAWQQTIDSLHYTVVAPGAPLTIRCEQGSIRFTGGCASSQRNRDGATFTGTDVAPGEAFTVRLTWPDSVVAVNAHDSALDPSDLLYAVLAGVAIAFVGWRYRRRWVQLLGAAQVQLWATFGPDVAGPQTEAYDLTDEPAIEFVPPMGLRPGEMGTLLETGGTRLLTATVVDLAARGALKITEVDGSWTLDRRNHDVVLTDDEQQVVTGLFEDAETTSLDDRGSEMGTLAGELSEHLTDDLEERGLAVPGTSAGGLHSRVHQWFTLVLGIAAVIIGAAVHVLMVTMTGSRAAAVGIEVLVVLALILGAGAIRARRVALGMTPKGLAAVWRVRGFDHFFTASEAMHDKAAADQGLLRQYMGYAIVFGHVSQWVAAFDAPDTSEWFNTTSPLDTAFIGFTAASLWSPPPSSSSSSGFGGGGFGAGGGSGGGGGGSW